MELEERKLKEIEWADARRTVDASDPTVHDQYHANMKYYSVVEASSRYAEDWMLENCRDKDVFEMACGNGGYAPRAAKVARSVTAADIAPMSIQQARQAGAQDPLLARIDYQVLDCENTGLPSQSFDVILEGGALHHMELDAAYGEAARLLRPGGKFFCLEAIRHNPLIHLYRKMTPHLRTEWEAEHILGRKEVLQGLKYFKRIEIEHFHFFVLLAVPFRNTAIFPVLHRALRFLDVVMGKIPGLQWLCWQAVFVLADPRSPSPETASSRG